MTPTSYPLALCEDDLYPWKHAGVTREAAVAAAERHALDSGHAIALYANGRRTARFVLTVTVTDG